MGKLSTFAVLLASLTLLPQAQAVREHDQLGQRPELEVAGGPASRRAVTVSARAPHRAAAAWKAFQQRAGGQWQAIWDRDTGIPMRIYGSGIATPGAVQDPVLAKRWATDIIKRHLNLLAPGTQETDFVVVSNEEHRGIRSVGFKQFKDGIEVKGGQLSMSFKNDRLVMLRSDALPYASSYGKEEVSHDRLIENAQSWVLQDSAKSVSGGTVEGPLVLPIVSPGHIDYHTVMAVTLEGKAPIGKWRVYLDVASGEPVAREQLLRFAEGTVRYNVPFRQPLSLRGPFSAPGTDLIVDGQEQTSDAEGLVTWTGDASVDVRVQPVGPLVKVNPQQGSLANEILTLAPGGEVSWNRSSDEFEDAQLASYIHTHIVKEYAKRLNPDLEFITTEQQPVNVNIDETCNAFSDGFSINFFKESSQCANTARLADVVYHEYGHSLHANSIIEGVGAFDGAFSEGLSDYLSATITNDPAMGLGFFKDDAPLRHIDPASREHVWPEDIAEIHFTGLIFAGAMWDLRKVLIDKYGEEDGIAQADRLFYGAVQRASNIPTTYAEVLLEDDDDGDLSNGTPNICDINATFALHGLRAVDAQAGNLSVVAPSEDGFAVNLVVNGLNESCPGDSILGATIDWELREDTETAGVVDMSEVDDTNYTGNIPSAPDGTVIRYKVSVEFADGSTKTFPDNAADPRYEFYVGEVTELYCTDFESVDPFSDGWTHELLQGEESEGADDWSWGPPLTDPAVGDPLFAYSGDNVIGNDLGEGDFNGRYQANKINRATSPVVDTMDYSDVRLQYRRFLTVEDSFFDQATIYANNNPVWVNLNSNNGDSSNTHHQDLEWVFHDVSLSSHVSTDGKIQVAYEINSDGGLELGGWTIDDFCIVANTNAICGDAQLYGPEECDDGDGNSNTEPDACRENCQQAFCGDGVLDTGEFCDDGNNEDGDGCASDCLLPPQNEGDCGCVVGSQRGLSAGASGLGFLGFAMLLMLRRRRRD